jgi:hypothetical protein
VCLCSRFWLTAGGCCEKMNRLMRLCITVAWSRKRTFQFTHSCPQRTNLGLLLGKQIL